MRRYLAAAASLAYPLEAMACSGPHALEHIQRSERLGLALWGATWLILGAFALVPRLRAQGLRKRWGFALLLLIHPGWWMSARSGDCGMTLVDGSIIVTCAAVFFGIIAWWRAGRK